MIDRALTYPIDELLADQGLVLYDRASSAAYAAYGRLEWHPDERFEDAQQAAAAAYWEAHQTNPLDRYAWTAGKLDALDTLLHNSVFTLSLDAADQRSGGDGGDPWIEHLATTPAYACPERSDRNTDTGHWLDDHDLHGLVKQLLARPSDSAVRYQAAILRLLATGYDTAAIAVELDRTEEAIKSTRRNLRKRLFAYCQEHAIDVEHIHVQVGGWRPAHHYAHMDNTAANRARWSKNNGHPKKGGNGHG